MTRCKLFVYGTLKRGQRRHDLLASGTFAGHARTTPTVRLYVLAEYPALVEVITAGESVEGELWDIPADEIDSMDRYEGSPYLFARRPIALEGFDPNLLVEAYFYVPTLPLATPTTTCWDGDDLTRNPSP